MVDGISGVNTGSIKELPVYQQYYQDYRAYNKACGTNLSFDAYLLLKGRKNYLLQEVENYLEGGGDGVNGNTLNGMRYMNNGNLSIYQSQDEDTYYEFDFNDGSYRIIHGKDEIASVLGLDGADFDTINFGFNKAEVTDYTFGNLEDGQDSTSSRVSGGLYSNVTYKQQEFDLDYIFNALLMNPNDPQYQIASQVFDDLVNNMKQWCSESDLAELDEIAAEYGTNSVQYKEKLKEVLLANLDQANEWIDDHAHLEYTEEVSDFDSNNSTETEDGQENTVPEYDKRAVIENSGYWSQYSSHQNIGGSWREGSDRNEQVAIDAQALMEPIINSIISSLKTQLGDEWTSEMDDYCLKVKRNLFDGFFVTKSESICDNGKIKSDDVWATTDCKGSKGHDKRAIVDVENLINKFFEEFNKICQNGGKTDKEIEDEKKAAEEKLAKEKAGYQKLYNMNMRSTASEAGVRDVTVVPTSNNQYAEIQEKAQTDIINPLKNKIKDKLKDSGIPEDELERILTYAEETALANPANWAETTNNYTYTISSSKLIDLFQDAVKSAVKSKGYDF